MSRANTRWGHYDQTLEEEIKRMIEELKRIGVHDPTKIEASALIAERSTRFMMTDFQAKEYIKRMRGIF